MVVQKICCNCGAPLKSLLCEYCDSSFESLKGPVVGAAGLSDSPEGYFKIQLGDREYAILGQLAQGQHSSVLLARLARRVTEQVVLKVALGLQGERTLKSEWAVLRELQGQCPYLDSLLPQLVGQGEVRGRWVLAYRWRSGFVHSLSRAKRDYPEGLPAVAVVWIWNRLLDQLASLEDLGFQHGELRLEHVLIHPRDHGVALCGWGQAGRGFGGDLQDSGRCMTELLGPKAPEPLKRLTREAGEFRNAEQLQGELRRVSRAVFGPPKFHKFALPRAR